MKRFTAWLSKKYTTPMRRAGSIVVIAGLVLLVLSLFGLVIDDPLYYRTYWLRAYYESYLFSNEWYCMFAWFSFAMLAIGIVLIQEWPLKIYLWVKGDSSKKTIPLAIHETIEDLLKEDMALLEKGIIPEARLLPQYAILRDIALLAYQKDFYKLPGDVRELNRWHYEAQINTIKQLNSTEIQAFFSQMKGVRFDMKQLENEVRRNNPIYNKIPPII